MKKGLEALLEKLGSSVWGPLNFGQGQCSCCSTAYEALEEAIDDLNKIIGDCDAKE